MGASQRPGHSPGDKAGPEPRGAGKSLEADGGGAGWRVGSPGPSGPGLARKGGRSDSLSRAPTRGHSPLCSRKTPSSSTLKERRLLRQPGHVQKRKPRGEAFQPQSCQPEQGSGSFSCDIARGPAVAKMSDMRLKGNRKSAGDPAVNLRAPHSHHCSLLAAGPRESGRSLCFHLPIKDRASS